MELDEKQIISMLDNMEGGFYILDKDGKYLYGNIAGMGPHRERRIGSDVHDLLKTGSVDLCISDLVRERKRALTLVQEVRMPGAKPHYQLITSTPIFDENGEIEYFFAELYNLTFLNEKYQSALLNEPTQRFFPVQYEEEQAVDMVAESPAMRRVLELADQVCNMDVPVLLYGESGTGKEVLAEYIYRKGDRRSKKLVTVNCAALPENLLEAELFGYEKGAFTGAASSGKKGLIEEADGGTLFLDEVNSIPLSIQAKLLRVLENRMVKRLGSNKSRFVDYRLIAATNEDLYQCCEEGRFRKDLYYRLNVVPLTLPPLRERREDIRPLVKMFLHQYCTQYKKLKNFSPEVFAALEAYDWPGNVRQLKNLVQRLVIMTTDNAITIQELPLSIFDSHFPVAEILPAQGRGAEDTTDVPGLDFSAGFFDLKAYLAECERQVLEKTLQKLGSTYKAAKFLGVDQSSVARKKLKYHIRYDEKMHQ